MKKLALLTLGLGLLAVPAAHAAPPNPFGHPCAPQSGVLLCATATDANRVPSFDGVPLDVDVTLPPTGNGPFPAIVMMHGWGGDKRSFESSSPAGGYNNVFYAQQGYAVINYSARGFGRSCGRADSRTAPACDRGWVHLTDHRYESRDTQHLLGLLVDEGVVKASAIGVTGISYGGIQSNNLAGLRNRIRLANGSFAPWRSPRGKPLEIKAAWARWGATDLTYSLTPNGRFLDFGPFSRSQSRTPAGVPKKSFNNGLYALGNITGFIAPLGADPTADITGWKAITDRGEPLRRDALAVARQLTDLHSSAGLPGVPAPLLVQNGWTDDLFPVPEALRAYVRYRHVKGAHLSFQFGDLGHGRGANKENENNLFNAQGARFFAAYLKGQGKPPARNSFTAFTQTCPKTLPAGGPFRASSWERLHPGTERFGARRAQRVTSDGGNPATAKKFDVVVGGDPCGTVPRERAPGTAIAQTTARRPFTLLGLPTVRATIKTSGPGGFIAARLFDVFQGEQTLVSRGVYRLEDDQRGRIVFQLFGNGWRVEPGHVVKLELIGNDPDYLRTSNDRFSVRVSNLRVSLPTSGPARPAK